MIQAAALADLTKLALDAEIELIEIDASAPSIGGDVLRYVNTSTPTGGAVLWKGLSYTPYPVLYEGVELTAKDASKQPTLTLGNLASSITTLVLLYNDLIGAKVTRRRVLAKYLDGMAGADNSMGKVEDVYYIERRLSENFQTVQFQLSNDLEIDEKQLPAMKCNAAHCGWLYRSSECTYTGRSVADRHGNTLVPGTDRGAWAAATSYSVSDEAYTLVDGIRYYAVCIAAHTSSSSLTIFNTAKWTGDQCSKRFNTGCEKRFDNDTTFPFLAFLGMARLPK